jgi:hypothetical protein
VEDALGVGVVDVAYPIADPPNPRPKLFSSATAPSM